MNKVVSVFLNPAIDNTIWVDSSDTDEPVSVVREERYAGGKGINVSKTLDVARVENTAVGLIGKENEHVFLPLLQSSVKNFKFLYHDGKTRENQTVVFPNGQILKINHSGKIENSILPRFKEMLLKEAKDASFVAFCGRMPSGIERDEYIDLMLSVKDKKLCVDTSSFSFEDYKKIRPYLIKPNKKELGDILGEEVSDPVASARKLVPFCENVLVSLGEEGAILVNESGAYKAVPPKIKALSNIGAGDAAFAGFLASKINGEDDKKALINAVAFGTAKALVEGTGTVSDSKVEEIKKQIKVNF